MFAILSGNGVIKFEEAIFCGNPLLKLWMRLSPNTKCTSTHIAEQILGRKPEHGDYLLFGYCPTVLKGNILVAKTLNAPGYTGTPERQYYERNCRRLKNTEVLTFHECQEANNFSLLKEFHTLGLDQVKTFAEKRS